MKTLEERVKTIEKKLGIKPRTGYTWTLSISDGYGPFTYVIENGSGNRSIQSVAEHVAEFLEGDLYRKPRE